MSFTLPAALQRNARERGDTLAFTDTRLSYTWTEFDARTNQVAHALSTLGLGLGERVAYVGRNRIEFFELLYGAAKIQAVTVPLNWRLTADEVAYLIDDSQAKLVVIEPEFAACVPSGVEVVAVGAAYEALVSGESAAAVSGAGCGPDTIALQSYTSGTTSMPKGALFSYRNLEHSMESGRSMGIGDSCAILAVLPVHHVGGSVFAIYPTYFGGSLIIPGTFEPELALEFVERYSITNLTSVPTIALMLAEAAVKAPRDISSLKSIVYGGAPMAPAELSKVQRVLATPMVNVYGMTECPAISFLPAAEHTPERVAAASIGRPFGGNEVSIRDPDSGMALSRGQRGELCIRAAGCTEGYWRNERRTADLYTSDGWLRTGDIASQDADGYLYLVDRATDLIITGGENVYPAEVERVLGAHEDIEAVAVVGLPDARWGEVVTAFVVPRPGANLTPTAVKQWSRPRLPGFRRPKHVILIDELPMTASGKVLRRELRSIGIDQPHSATAPVITNDARTQQATR